jgi:hypothetical protein
MQRPLSVKVGANFADKRQSHGQYRSFATEFVVSFRYSFGRKKEFGGGGVLSVQLMSLHLSVFGLILTPKLMVRCFENSASKSHIFQAVSVLGYIDA